MAGKKRIGLFDSGLGGMSVLAGLIRELPSVDYYYLADRQHAPYGALSEEAILERSRFCLDVLRQKDCDLVVMACNTATAYAVDKLRQETDIPIVGVEPYVNILNHREDLEGKKVGLMVTPQMGASERLQKLMKNRDPGARITVIPMPTLAGLIDESLDNQDVQGRIEEALVPLTGMDMLILGCTHYPLFQETIERVTGAETICPARAVARQVARLVGSDADSCPSQNFHFARTPELEWDLRPVSFFEQWPK